MGVRPSGGINRRPLPPAGFVGTWKTGDYARLERQQAHYYESVVEPVDSHKVIDRCPGCGSREAARFPDGHLRCAYCRTAVMSPDVNKPTKRTYVTTPPTTTELSPVVHVQDGYVYVLREGTYYDPETETHVTVH